MARLIVYYAHPGHKYSKANRAMVAQAREVRAVQRLAVDQDPS